MWFPGQALSQEVVNMILAALNNTEVKAELAKQIRIEMDSQRNKRDGSVQSYESLTSGNVNMQARMAASGYDVYGNTIIQSNNAYTNKNVHKKMKNRIQYGKTPQKGYENRGGYHVV